jgi:O-methyltransferase
MGKLGKIIAKTIRKLRGKDRFPPDFEDDDKAIIKLVEPFTKTSRERILAMIRSVQYITRNEISGAIVECGVYKGGSMLAAARALLAMNCQNRDLFLFDTFEGMAEPTDKDVNIKGLIAVDERQNRKVWSRCPLEAVQASFGEIAYNPELIHYVEGMVEDTIPNQAPERIALLRLDTDWYESTLHELEHLYPRLVSGGVLIIDDYGHWRGAREAVDEYIDKHKLKLFLNRIDYTGRLCIKP